ncbi:MAG: type II secretion system F family protein [Pseudomonadota bacterium]
MRYVVRAVDPAQQIHTLLLEALDEADAHAQARAQLLNPLSVSLSRAAAWRREDKFPLLLFAQELHALLAAGLSVIESLDALIEKDTQASRRAVLSRVAEQLRQGQRLSSALRNQPGIFPALFVGVIEAAEGTSDLPQALARFLDYETRVQSVRHQVTSAAIYPAILLVVGLAVSLFLLGYVVPRFSAVYQGSGRSLPWASQMLMNWGQFAGQHAGEMLAGLVACFSFVAWWLRRAVAQGGWWRFLRRLPGARPRLHILQLSRLYLTLGMLLEGGIPVQHALKLCTAVVDIAARVQLDAVRGDVESGLSLSESLQLHGLSTPVALRLLRVGEQSGQMGLMLGRTATFYDQETTRWVERFSKAFEPMLMAAIGLVIGLIVILLYMPIFDLAGSLQ